MSYTISDVFLPQDGSVVDGLTVEAYAVSTWSGANTPPHLGDAPPGSPDASGTTSTDFGNHGAWEIELATNEDYFVVVEYSSSYYWKRYNVPAWTDGATGELDVTSLTINAYTAAGLDTFDGDIAAVSTDPSAGSTGLGADAGHVHAGLGQPIGLTGATDATRYAGGTTSGAPLSGTFEAGDFVVDASGAIWIWTSSSSWVQLAPAGAGGAVPSGTIVSFAGITVPAGGWLACDGSEQSRSGYADLFDALSISFAGTLTTSSAIVTGIADTSSLEAGWPISGTGIPSGTTISSVDSGTEITLTNAATVSGSESLVAAPWGIGDGGSTFNLPDLRARVPVGSGSAGSNSSDTFGSSPGSTPLTLGETSGEQAHVLSTAELAAHTHGMAQDHTHGVAASSHTHGMAEDHTHGVSVDTSTNAAGLYDPGHSHSYLGYNEWVGVASGSSHVDVWNAQKADETNNQTTAIVDDGHAHSVTTTAGAATSFSTDGGASFSTGNETSFSTDNGTGSGDAHNNMSPFGAVNYLVKT